MGAARAGTYLRRNSPAASGKRPGRAAGASPPAEETQRRGRVSGRGAGVPRDRPLEPPHLRVRAAALVLRLVDQRRLDLIQIPLSRGTVAARLLLLAPLVLEGDQLVVGPEVVPSAGRPGARAAAAAAASPAAAAAAELGHGGAAGRGRRSRSPWPPAPGPAGHPPLPPSRSPARFVSRRGGRSHKV